MRIFRWTLALLLFSWISPAFGSAQPQVHFYNKDGQAKEVAWKIKTFSILKKDYGYEYKVFQTWVGLPPLLRLENQNSDFSVVENSTENNSPFANDATIKQVLRIEHFKNDLVLPLKIKGRSPEQSGSQIRLENLIQKPVVHVAPECEKRIQEPKLIDQKILLSIGCRRSEKNLTVVIWTSENLLPMNPDGNEAVHSRDGESGLTLHLESDRNILKTPSKWIDLFRSLPNKKLELTTSLFLSPSNDMKDWSRFERRLTRNKESKIYKKQNLSAKSSSFSIGALTSNVGMEVDLRARHFIAAENSLSFRLLTPIKFFSNNRQNLFLDTEAHFSTILHSAKSTIFTAGGGLRINSVESRNSRKALLGPSLFMELALPNVQSFSSSISLTPSYLGEFNRSSRIFWDVANIRVYRDDTVDTHFNVQFSYVRFRFENYSLENSKALFGFLFRW